MSSKIKQRKASRYKEAEEQPKNDEYKQANALDGGFADDLTIEDIAKMHDISLDKMVKQLKMGIKVEYEHTKDKTISTEIALDHLYEIPDYYTRLAKMEDEAKKEGKLSEPEDKKEGKLTESKKQSTDKIILSFLRKYKGNKVLDKDVHNLAKKLNIETDELESKIYKFAVKYANSSKEGDVDEAMGAGGAGQFSAPMGSPIKRDFHKMKNSKDYLSEAAPGSSGQYDLPAFNSKKGPLGIDGTKSIKQRAKTIDKRKSFPKFGGPDAVFVKIKEKCKKFPYCNQDPNAIELLKEDADIKKAISEVSQKRGIPYKEIENLVINEIKAIFI